MDNSFSATSGSSSAPARTNGPEWLISDDPVDYPDAMALMEKRVAAIASGAERDLVWLLEHPPLYTAGTSARAEDLLDSRGLPVYKTGRGGQYTYHGPGQRIAYVMMDLRRRGPDVRAYIHSLEEWIIHTLDRFNVIGERRDGRVGIWVDRQREGGLTAREDKIAAIGVRVRHWVAFHGIAINVDPDISQFGGIVPCGIRDHGVTSLVDLGRPVTMADVDMALKEAWMEVFGSGE